MQLPMHIFTWSGFLPSWLNTPLLAGRADPRQDSGCYKALVELHSLHKEKANLLFPVSFCPTHFNSTLQVSPL